jgi:uncharacterized protein (DUF1501 family)
MHTDTSNHEPGLLLMHSGNQQPTRPSLGSWVSYGLGCANQNLPAFVVLTPGRPVVGPQLWSSSFLPGAHQGMAVNTSDMRVERLVANLNHPRLDRAGQRKQLDLLQALNNMHREQRPEEAALDAQIQALETAFGMQRQASEAFDVHREPAAVRDRYGDSDFGHACLLARRLVERGVPFVEVNLGAAPGVPQGWDTHGQNFDAVRRLCEILDPAWATLLHDLNARGLLDSTLIVWMGEFGRTPRINPQQGRDHFPNAWTTVLSGGGIRGGQAYGATSADGTQVKGPRPVSVADLLATVCRALGLDPNHPNMSNVGRPIPLVDRGAQALADILA